MENNFESLLKHNITMYEPFIDKTQTIYSTETVLVGIALMVGAAMFAILFMWAYQNGGKSLFIVLYATLVFAFVIEMVILIISKREVLTPMAYQIYIGSTITIGLVSLVFITYFSRAYSRSSAASQAPVAAPTAFPPRQF